MFDLIRFDIPGQPFSQRSVGSYANLDELAADYPGFSGDDLTALINGDLVHESFILEWHTGFLRDLAIDALIEERGAMGYDEIADVLGESYWAVQKCLKRAMSKLRRSRRVADLAREYEIVVRTSVSIDDEEVE